MGAAGAYMPLSGMCAARGCRILGCHARAIIMGSIIFTILPPAPTAARGLVSSTDQWAWSSFRFYYLQDSSLLPMDRLP